MKREEKNLQTRRRIMDSALNEFSKQGYGASSINTICSAQGISKGIIYHYFKTKDDLFLACVEAVSYTHLGVILWFFILAVQETAPLWHCLLYTSI